jgi:hypothetical protein
MHCPLLPARKEYMQLENKTNKRIHEDYSLLGYSTM